jgi:serine/threonine protein kinase
LPCRTLSLLSIDDTVIPRDLQCPINFTLFIDPVVANDGHTYERSAITRWISQNPRSPITRDILFLDRLNPNRIVKKMVDDYLSESRRKTLQYKYKLNVDLNMSESLVSSTFKHKRKYLIEWLKIHDTLDTSNTVLVHLTGDKAEILADICCNLPTDSHIIGTYGRVEHDTTGILLVQEYLSVQTLAQWLTDNSEKISVKIIDMIVYQIACALEHLANNDVIHGYLDYDDILMIHFDYVNDIVQVKLMNISDYLIADEKLETIDPNRIAPEIFVNGLYTKQSDVYTFGVLALELYSNESNNVTRQALFNQCLAVNSNNRPTIQELTASIKKWIDKNECMNEDHTLE